MKKWLIISALVILSITIVFYIFIAEPQSLSENKKARLVNDVVSYIKTQTEDYSAQEMQYDTDGYLIESTMTDTLAIERLLYHVENPEQIRVVRNIPELAHPVIHCGSRVTGNYQKLYYDIPLSNMFLEFSLSYDDSMEFFLYITNNGTLYPEVREYFITRALDFLQDETVIADADELDFMNGDLSSIEVKSKATLNRLRNYIINCQSIHDYYGVALAPSAGPNIYVKSIPVGNWESFFLQNQARDRVYGYHFTEEDAADFFNYLLDLTKDR